MDSHLTFGRLENSGHQLEQSTLTGSVLANDAERLAGLNLERNVAQRPEVAVAAQTVEGDQLGEPMPRLFIDWVAFRNAFKLDGKHYPESTWADGADATSTFKRRQ